MPKHPLFKGYIFCRLPVVSERGGVIIMVEIGG